MSPSMSANLSFAIKTRNLSSFGRICCIFRLQKCKPLDVNAISEEFGCDKDTQVGLLGNEYILSF